MVKRRNTFLWFSLIEEQVCDPSCKEIIGCLKEYVHELECVVFPPIRDPLVQDWIDDGLIRGSVYDYEE